MLTAAKALYTGDQGTVSDIQMASDTLNKIYDDELQDNIEDYALGGVRDLEKTHNTWKTKAYLQLCVNKVSNSTQDHLPPLPSNSGEKVSKFKFIVTSAGDRTNNEMSTVTTTTATTSKRSPSPDAVTSKVKRHKSVSPSTHKKKNNKSHKSGRGVQSVVNPQAKHC